MCLTAVFILQYLLFLMIVPQNEEKAQSESFNTESYTTIAQSTVNEQSTFILD